MTTTPRAAPPSDETVTGFDWSQWTVILLKPDCLARNLVRPVLAMAAQHVRITAERIVYPTAEQVFTHYADIVPLSAELGVDVAAELRRIYLGHPVAVALGHGPDAAIRLRAALGPTDPAKAGPLMPTSQQAALDPYMALVVGYRKSGLSLNHIIGCPLDCGYCVRHFWGNSEVKTRTCSAPMTRLLTCSPATTLSSRTPPRSSF